MGGSHTNPDGSNFLQRLNRDLTAMILSDQNCNILALKDRLLQYNFREMDFGKHYGTPKFLQGQSLTASTISSEEGIVAIAGNFHMSQFM